MWGLPERATHAHQGSATCLGALEGFQWGPGEGWPLPRKGRKEACVGARLGCAVRVAGAHVKWLGC